MKVYYKIRDKSNGLFSQGGSYGWTKKGKVWKEVGHLRNHLNHSGDRYDRLDVELVEYEVTEREVSSSNFHEFIEETNRRKAIKEKERDIASAHWALESAKRRAKEALANLEKLQNKANKS